MTVRLEAVTFDVVDPATTAEFWAGLLGREPVPEADGVLLPGDTTQVGIRFTHVDIPSPSGRDLHLHLTSTSVADQQRTVDAVVRLGGRRLDVGQLPEESHVVLADPGGNPLCVIGPESTFVAGCGYLGEVACDGHREVGLFWRDVLDWALVWDDDGETAVQAPEGGTKIAWGGPPVDAKQGRNPQRFDLLAGDLPAEIERLTALGATVLRNTGPAAELADPDGNEFTLRQG